MNAKRLRKMYETVEQVKSASPQIGAVATIQALAILIVRSDAYIEAMFALRAMHLSPIIKCWILGLIRAAPAHRIRRAIEYISSADETDRPLLYFEESTVWRREFASIYASALVSSVRAGNRGLWDQLRTRLAACDSTHKE